MDVQKKLDEIVETVGNARSMPMSASCVVNRAELLAMLEEVRAGPARFARPGPGAHRRPRAARRAGPPGGRADHRVGPRRARLADLRHRDRPAVPGRGGPDPRPRPAGRPRRSAPRPTSTSTASSPTSRSSSPRPSAPSTAAARSSSAAAKASTSRATRTRTPPSAAPTRRRCAAAPTTTSTPSSAPSRPCWPRPWRPSAGAARSCTAGSPPTTSARTWPPRTPRAPPAHQRRGLLGRPRRQLAEPEPRPAAGPAAGSPAQPPTPSSSRLRQQAAYGPAAQTADPYGYQEQAYAARRTRTATSSSPTATPTSSRATTPSRPRTTRTSSTAYLAQQAQRPAAAAAGAGRARRDQPLRHQHDRPGTAAPLRTGPLTRSGATGLGAERNVQYPGSSVARMSAIPAARNTAGRRPPELAQTRKQEKP